MSLDLLAPMETLDQVIPNCHCLVCGSSEDLLLARSIGTGGRIDYGVRLAAVCSACGARSPVERITGSRVQRLCTDDEYAAEVVSLLWADWKACAALTADAHPASSAKVALDPEISAETPLAIRYTRSQEVEQLQRRRANLTFADALNLYLARVLTDETFVTADAAPDLCGGANVAAAYLGIRQEKNPGSAHISWAVSSTTEVYLGTRYMAKIHDWQGEASTFGVAVALALLHTLRNGEEDVFAPLLREDAP